MLTPAVVLVPLEGGGSILFQVDPADVPADPHGPVKAGRVADAVRELPQTLQTAMGPVTDMARAVLEQLRRAGPDAVTVEFGVNLAAQAGAVIAKSEAGCHLKVTMAWNGTAHADQGAS
ncbi:CU044_2847 family protein [Streptomyces sp. M41]|uniref:CU044_2847 family protein n=1 Tax=Streptomyces sp. M41 TaxID=3059412 RepID=UPI00374D688B